MPHVDTHSPCLDLWLEKKRLLKIVTIQKGKKKKQKPKHRFSCTLEEYVTTDLPLSRAPHRLNRHKAFFLQVPSSTEELNSNET